MKIRTRRRLRLAVNWGRWMIAAPFCFLGFLLLSIGMAFTEEDPS